MKSLGIATLSGSLLILIAVGLARISQLLAAHLPWPLLVLCVGGAIGATASLVWQQQWIRSWRVLLAWCVVATVVLAAAEHYFAWQHLIAAQESEWLKAIREQPQLGTFPSPFEPPTFTQFMSGGSEPARTWAWWIFDASVKGLIAIGILMYRRSSLPQQVSPTESEQ
jgi:hypothetical protein